MLPKITRQEFEDWLNVDEGKDSESKNNSLGEEHLKQGSRCTQEMEMGLPSQASLRDLSLHFCDRPTVGVISVLFCTFAIN